MSGHTPGPWVVAPTSHAGRLRYDVLAGDEEALQLVADVDTEANARLIAAAPELLAALKGVVAIADRKTVEFDRARAVITKAEA